MTLQEIVAAIAEWSEPRSVDASGLRLASRISPPATADAIGAAFRSQRLPAEVRQLWLACGDATLFRDVDFGQWGLQILSPMESVTRSVTERLRRPKDFGERDVVLGEFLGDQDVLVVEESGAVLVAPPLDDRNGWYRVAPSVVEFLARYVQREGAKYWEDTTTRRA